MELEPGGRFTFTGRWRGRRTWVLALASLLSAALALSLLWYLPSRGGEENLAAEAAGEETLAGGSAVPGVGQAEEAPAPYPTTAQDGGQGRGATAPASPAPAPAPAPGSNPPGLVVEFPDPVGGGEEPPPPQGYGDILGNWVLDMTGSAYGLSNCHLRFEENGKITTPPEYEQVFLIKESEYVWEKGTGSFAAAMLVMVKLGPSQGAVPAEIYLVGQVGAGFTEITGEFVAEPQGEAYSPYAQRGTFRMRR